MCFGEKGRRYSVPFSMAGKIKSYVNRKCFSYNECSFYSALLYNIQNCVFIRGSPGREPMRFSFNLIFWVLIFVKSTMACISKSERSGLTAPTISYHFWGMFVFQTKNWVGA